MTDNPWPLLTIIAVLLAGVGWWECWQYARMVLEISSKYKRILAQYKDVVERQNSQIEELFKLNDKLRKQQPVRLVTFGNEADTIQEN